MCLLVWGRLIKSIVPLASLVLFTRLVFQPRLAVMEFVTGCKLNTVCCCASNFMVTCGSALTTTSSSCGSNVVCRSFVSPAARCLRPRCLCERSPSLQSVSFVFLLRWRSRALFSYCGELQPSTYFTVSPAAAVAGSRQPVSGSSLV